MTMKKSNLLELIKKNVEGSLPAGFRFISRGNGQWFERTVDSGIERLDIGVAVYSRCVLTFITTSRQFKKVEEMICYYYNHYGEHNYKLNLLYTIKENNRDVFGKTGIDVHSESEAMVGIEKMKVFFEKESFPFFNKFSSVKNLNLYLNSTVDKEAIRLLGGGYPAHLRKMIIAFLADDVNSYYKSELETKQLFHSQKNTGKIYERHWNVFMKLSAEINKQINDA